IPGTGILVFILLMSWLNAGLGQTTYTWNQTGTASWATTTNWTPTRTTPATNDILVFNNGATTTVTSVPTQTIGQLSVSSNTTVNLQAAAAATVLTIGGGTGTDLIVDSGSALNINGTNSTKILVATGATGRITGNMTYTAAVHTLDAADASGITFNSPSIFTQGTGCTGNVFTAAGTANAIVFTSGTIFSQLAGSNPFGLTQPSSKVVFQTGSLFKHQQSGTPSFSGRTYADFEYNIAATVSVTGASAVSLNNFTIDLNTFNFNMTGTPGHAIKGNVSVLSGTTLNFNPASAGTINFNGTSAQTISDAGTLTFASNQAIALGNTTNTIFAQNSATNFSIPGVVSTSSGSTPLTFSGTGSGRIDITGTVNTFTGPISFTGSETRFSADGSFGNVNNTIVIDGGRLATLNSTTYTLSSTHNIQVSDVAGNSISTPGSGVLTYNGIIADKPSTTGAWAKQGGGTLALGGVSTYTGSTSINNGILQLTTGSDRLPIGTTLDLGQSASTNLGTLDLNGQNQTIAGLNSTTGTNSTASNNTVTSTGAATLTLGGSGTYTYGDGTDTNSGVISGAVSIVKSGSGTQTFGDANTYTGTTSVNAGILTINGVQTGTGAVTVAASATLGGSGTIPGTISLTGKISPGTSPGTINTGAFTFNANATYKFEISNATGVAGTDWDKLVSTGAIDVSASPITIDLTSISISNFNNANPYTWIIASGSSITGFNAGNFTVSTTNFSPTLAGGTFSVTQTGNDLNLVFTPGASIPTLTSPTAVAITNSSADLGATITLDGGSAITARGTVYKTTAGVLSTDNPLAEGGTSTGAFSHTRSGLNGETQYYYAGYATNGSGTALSPESNFRTLSNPPTSEATGFSATAFSASQIDLNWTVATFPVSGATANGYILLRRQDNSNPSTSGIFNAVAPGSLSLPSGTTLVTTLTSGSTNNYSNTGLTSSTQYNYLIVPFTWDGTNTNTYNYYLTNAPVANATTQAGLPVVTTPTVTNINSTSADLGANVTTDGGSALTARGTVYKTSTGVVITDNPLAEGGLTTGVFSHTRNSLNPETQYFFKGYATNGNGSGLSSESSFYTFSASPTSEVTGFSGTPVSATQINLSWTAATFPGAGATDTGYAIVRRSDSTNPSTTGIVNGVDPASLSLPGGTLLTATITSGATTSFNNTGLNANAQYNYLIVPFTWDGVNTATYNYYLTNAATTNATTLPAVPSLNNPTATGITENSAVLGATITSDNGGAISERGTVYKTSSPVTATDNPLAEGGLAVGTFSQTRSPLSPETQYFYAGYAINPGGTGLSNEGNFRTLSNPPTSEVTNFTATAFSPTQIDLGWTIATFPGMGATANGYIILRKIGTNPATTGIVNATAPGGFSLPVGTTLVTTINSGATNSYNNTGLTAGNQYNYLIIPFTWDGTNAATYNYYLINGATANATTPLLKQTFASDGSAFSASKWSAATNTTCDLTNLTNAFASGSIANFCTVAGTGTGATITVAGITATENFTLTAAGGTISNLSNGIIPIDVAPGKTLDLSTQNLSGSATGGYIKNNTGILATTGNTYAGGFTLNAGTIIVRGVNAMGSGGSNTLTLNGGIVASNANRDLSGKYPGGITIGGDVQFGDIGGLAGNFSLTFSNAVSLGNVTRTFTKGHTSNVIFSGVISGTNGITYAANANATSGVFTISNIANTYTGTTSITGGEVEFPGGDGAFGAVPGVLTPNSIIIDGGRLTVNTAATTTLNANRGIQIGASANTGISVKTGVTVLVYNGVIADKPSTTGSWAKQGGNVFQLGGVSTYTGSTSVNNGTLQLITDSNRLPTGTTLNLGQAASANLGTFNMNGFSQQVAGINSTPGANASVNNNTITSIAAATLTLGGNGTYNYGDGTNGNSGVITGAISLVKNGTGTQTLGDANTYTGNTTINSGELRYTPSVNTSLAGSLILNGGILGTSGITATRTLTFSSFDLSDNSNIDLSTVSDHTITFTVAGTFTSGKTLTIYGWQGIGGASGTKGKIFYSNSAAGLTAGQLAQIQFNNGTISGPGTNYAAVILSTGEVVSSTTIGANNPPTIVINVAATTDYIDGGVGTSPASPYAVSGVISDPTDPFNILGIDFTISDVETAVGSLVVTASSSMTSVVPNANINLTGSGASRNVKITPAAVGYTNITVTVSDGVNSTSYIINYAASAASVNTSTTRFLTGTSDASTAQGVGTDYMLVGDDENQALRLYNRFNSGLPVNGFDYSVSLGISPTNPEVDIEGSAEVGNRIYWLGSHSNSANAGNLRPNRYRLFATDVTGSGVGATLSYVGRYDGLRTDLLAWDASNGHGLGANYFGLTASAADGVIPEAADGSGFNIEGLTIAPDNSTAYICFRAPISPASNRINGLIVPVTNLTALVTGNPSTGPATFGAPIMLDLGGRGIREIMRNASGQYIIMAGPHDGGNNFKLYTWTGNAADAPEARSVDLTALMTGGSIESIVNVPDPLLSTSVIQVLVDNGDTQFYNDGIIAKELPNPNHRKFRSEIITLGCRATRTPTVNGPLCAGLQSVSGTSNEADGTMIEVFVNGSSVGTTTVSSGTWTKTGVNLGGSNLVKATALASGECVSLFSNTVTVTPPVVMNTNNSGSGSLRDIIGCVG
ncbi:MAG: autotransporter-associated beta strand repeat-containing protein, partial [Saprospiraceae bacterium]